MHTCIPKPCFSSICIENQIGFGMQIERRTRIPPHSCAYQGIGRRGYMYSCIRKFWFSSIFIKNVLDLGMQLDVLTSIPPRSSAYHGIRPWGYMHTCIAKPKICSKIIKNLLDFGMQADSKKRELPHTSIPLRSSAYYCIKRQGINAYMHTITKNLL